MKTFPHKSVIAFIIILSIPWLLVQLELTTVQDAVIMDISGIVAAIVTYLLFDRKKAK